MDTKISQNKPAHLAPEDLETIVGEVETIVAEVEARLKIKLEQLLPKVQASTVPNFSNDDASFLIWMAGFTAGANLDRDGERGERIFARCRDIRDKLFAQGGANAS